MTTPASLGVEPPCPTFSCAAEWVDECKHCGWTEAAHDGANAIRAELDRLQGENERLTRQVQAEVARLTEERDVAHALAERLTQEAQIHAQEAVALQQHSSVREAAQSALSFLETVDWNDDTSETDAANIRQSLEVALEPPNRLQQQQDATTALIAKTDIEEARSLAAYALGDLDAHSHIERLRLILDWADKAVRLLHRIGNTDQLAALSVPVATTRRSFSELRAKMSPASQARATERTEAMLDEIQRTTCPYCKQPVDGMSPGVTASAHSACVDKTAAGANPLPRTAVPVATRTQEGDLPPQEWRDIASAPKTSRHILVWTPANKCTSIVTWAHDLQCWTHAFCGYDRRLLEEPTHYQPLPSPPGDPLVAPPGEQT